MVLIGCGLQACNIIDAVLLERLVAIVDPAPVLIAAKRSIRIAYDRPG